MRDSSLRCARVIDRPRIRRAYTMAHRERHARRLPKASANVQPIWDITLIPFRPVLVVLGRGNSGRYCITPVYRQAARIAVAIAPVRFIFQCAPQWNDSLRQGYTRGYNLRPIVRMYMYRTCVTRELICEDATRVFRLTDSSSRPEIRARAPRENGSRFR